MCKKIKLSIFLKKNATVICAYQAKTAITKKESTMFPVNTSFTGLLSCSDGGKQTCK